MAQFNSWQSAGAGRLTLPHAGKVYTCAAPFFLLIATDGRRYGCSERSAAHRVMELTESTKVSPATPADAASYKLS